MRRLLYIAITCIVAVAGLYGCGSGGGKTASSSSLAAATHGGGRTVTVVLGVKGFA